MQRNATVAAHAVARRAGFAVVATCSVAACGSRTPLGVDPGDGLAEVVPPDAGRRPLRECVMGSRAIGKVPIDLFITLDRSRSMDTVDRGSTMTRWEAVAAAVDGFINSPLSSGIGAGIAFFPRTASDGRPLCGTGDYAFPVVPIGPLPDVAPSILKAIAVQTRASGTPTTPAIEGAHLYTRSQQVASGDHTAALVVVTDGAPRDCASSIASTSAVAAAAIAASPPIRTYVLGVGPNLANLNAIAQAGGTTQAYLVESSGEGALLAAFEAIRTSALACEYVIPPGDPLTDADVLSVSTRTGADGATTQVGQVENAEACASQVGWFYDNPITSTGPPPSKVVLCPAACDPLVKTTGNRLDVAIDCNPR